MPVIAVPKVLREKLGEDGAEALVELINQADGQTKADVLTFVEEKFERRLTEVAARLDNRITEEAARLDKRITEEVVKLEAKIADAKTDIIRWMFIFWVGQVGALLGILFVFFKK